MGDPYFCPECNRNHTKGKIYKEHFKFAQNPDEDIKNPDSNDDDYDDEEELIEAFNELEEEYENDEIDDNDEDNSDYEATEDDIIEDDSIEEDSNSENDLDECIKAVKALPGVGKTTLEKLVKAGFNSLEAIAYTPPSIISEDSGLGEKTTAKLIKASMQKLGIGFKSGVEIWEHRKNIARITTNNKELDDLFGGGIETGSITEFFGEFRTGKTQIMHQLCVMVQMPREKGGLEGNALYIDTEGTFRPERIIQMSEALDLDYNKVLKNIVFGRAYNSDHQILLVKDAANLIKEKNIKLIIVDSIIGHFRSEYVGRGTLANRQQSINQHLHDLLRLCDIYPELAVCVTNQVSSKPDVFYGNPTTHTGGHIIAHGTTVRIYLRKGKGEQRIAKIVDAPHLPEGEAVFAITEEGIAE
ncbi:MAG: DNA repair and recombination protein RadA [Promethearchaeota archaeon]|nr:MAG: DNA repair and recombination protein RadA [Candidatus Lokiarchaeota archaeon]